MKKTILKMIAVAGIVTGTVFTSNAQISIGVTGGFGTAMDLVKPINRFTRNLASENGFSVGITGRYWLNKKMSTGINISYFSFDVKKFWGVNIPNSVTSSYSVTPISLAFDYYFMDEGFKPFAGLEVGYMMCSWSTKFDANAEGTGEPAFKTSMKNNGLFLAPVIGAAYGVNDKFDIILNTKYLFGINGGKQEWIISKDFSPDESEQIDAIASSFVNVNLGVSYKFGN
jgi:hypothetical protein